MVRLLSPVRKEPPNEVCLDRPPNLSVCVSSAVPACVLSCSAPCLQRSFAYDIKVCCVSPSVELLEVRLSLLELLEDALLKPLLEVGHNSEFLCSFLRRDSFHPSQACSEHLSTLELRKSPLSSIKRVIALISLRDPGDESSLLELAVVYALKEGDSRCQRPLVQRFHNDAVIDPIFESIDA
jgi:hypothetical protein